MCDKDTCNDASCFGECEPWNCVEQQINDALATKKEQLQGYVNEAKDSAAESKASAEASAQSATESKELRDEAETAASTAVAAEGVVLGVANTLQDTADKLEQIADELNTAIAGIAVASWFYTTVSENQTVITVPEDKNAIDVQSIYIKGTRQSPFRGFKFDKTAMTITLAEPLPLGLEIEIILGTYNSDNPNDFSHTLASNNGASLVGTTSGNTVQQELNELKNSTADLSVAFDPILARLAAELGLTVAGSFETGVTLITTTDAVALKSEGKLYTWGGTLPKTVNAGETIGNTGGESPTAWIRVDQKTLRQQLSSNDGAALINTSRGNTVEAEASWSYFGVAVNVMDYPSLKAAINALPVFGGRVIVPTGNYFVGDYDAATDYMSKPNVTIIGSAMPRPNSDASALVGGSVLEGRFNACANGLTVINVGFDMGKAVREKYWPGVDTAVEYLRGGTWDAFSHSQPSQSSPVGGTVGFHLENVIGLCEKSETIGHAVLIENVVEGYCDNVVGVYGVHGVVIKSANMRIGSIAGYMAKVDNVIFKSDMYAAGGNIQVDSVTAKRYYPNVTPHSVPAKAMAGIYFNPETQHFTGPISIGMFHCSGAEYAILCANANSGKVGGDIKLGIVDVDTDIDFALFSSNFGEFPRFYIDVLTVKNAKTGIYVNWPNVNNSGQIQTAIGTLNAYQIESNAIVAGGYARLHIDNVNIYGASTAYYVTEFSRMTVGVEHVTGATAKWSTPPVLGTGWTNEGGINSDFDVIYAGGKVYLKGLLRSAANAGATVLTLPPFLCPVKTHRFIALYNAGVCAITVLPSGAVQIGNVVPSADKFLSLEGIGWTL